MRLICYLFNLKYYTLIKYLPPFLVLLNGGKALCKPVSFPLKPLPQSGGGGRGEGVSWSENTLFRIWVLGHTKPSVLNGKFVETKEDVKLEANSSLDDGELFNNYISNLLDILQNSFLISILVSLLLLLILGFLFFKFIADKDLKFNWIKKLYFGDKIHYLVVKIIAQWGNTSLVWVFLGLIFIIIINLFNSYFLFYLLIEFKNLFSK